MKNSMNVRHVFTENQKKAILQTVARKVAMSVCRFRDTIQASELDGCGDFLVYGAFVSLKCRGELRACCGWVGDSVALVDALNQAALRAATDDNRFAPIMTSELREMKVDVWVLTGPELIAGKGPVRAEFVEIGKHGLIVATPRHRGLLLPGVAVEMNLNPVEFLEHTCRKAGLPKNAWLDEQTMVLRFEGDCFSGTLYDLLPETFPKDQIAPPRAPQERDVAMLADYTKQNIHKVLKGKSPDLYIAGIYDGNVNGICLRSHFSDHTTDTVQMAIGKAAPLQATLWNMAMRTAETILRSNGRELPDQVDLCVFWGIEACGTAAKPTLDKLNTRQEGLLLVRFGRWILTYTSRQMPERLLLEALAEAGFAEDADTEVYSVNVACTASSFMTSSNQKPNVQVAARQPFAAGGFYPGMSGELDKMLDSLFADEPTQKAAKPAKGAKASAKGKVETPAAGAVIVPHAGWKYSGRLAAQTLKRAGTIPELVLAFGTKHTPMGVDWAVSPCSRWELPGKALEGEPELAKAMTNTVPEFQLDTYAHAREHSLEVVLPLLARVAPQTHVIGTVMAGGQPEMLKSAAKKMAGWIRTLPKRPLLLASSDMNHYADEERTNQLDAMAIEAIEAKDPLRLLEVVRKNEISMCGVVPVAFVMLVLQELKGDYEVETVGHTTSAEASGDTSSVVGYYGAVLR